MKNYDVSIIVPVYNVEKFIGKCATTLFNQDYQNIEYIFVNDATPDNSMEVLQSVINRFPNRKDDIRIINKPQNEGLGQARKTGVENATGEYILHIDSDDWVELDMVSSLYKIAKDENADIVCCDYFMNFKEREVYKSANYIDDKNAYSSTKECIKNLLAMYISVSVCDKLVKKELYNKVKFPDFSHGEDSFINLQIFYKADKVIYFKKAFYHYNKTNTGSITFHNSSSKNINDFKCFSSDICSFLKEKKIYDKFVAYHYIGLLELVIPSSMENFKRDIKDIAPEANNIKYLWKNKKFGFLRKVVYSSVFFNMGFVVKYAKRIYRKIN